MRQRDWAEWHRGYDEPGSALALRLLAIQQRIVDALDACPPGPLRAVSLCAGQGRDLIGVLAAHPRGRDVRARLVERDPRNTAVAAAAAAGLDGVEIVTGDASLTDAYDGAVPAHVVLVCGLFDNIADRDIEHTISYLPQLCARGGTVIWTRNRRPPDITPLICRWFERAGFEAIWLSPPEETAYGVGVHRFTRHPRPLRRGVRLFTFVGYDAVRGGRRPA